MTDIDTWKSALLRLPDDAFFDIMRNYLGKLKTPFNKHHLIRRLEAFLRKEETQRRISELIDEDDASLLSAIYHLNEPRQQRLFDFFREEKSYLELHQSVLNMEDRLLIFRDPESGRLHINPLLYSALAETALSIGHLAPSAAASGKAHPLPWMHDALLVAFFSFLGEQPDLFKADGELRKRALRELSERFPALFMNGSHGDRLYLLANTLRRCGLLETDGGSVGLLHETWRSFAALSRPERHMFLWAAAAVGEKEEKNARHIQELAGALGALLPHLPPGRRFSMDALLRLFRIVAGDGGVVLSEESVSTLVSLDLIIEDRPDTYTVNQHVNEITHPAAEQHEAAAVIHANSEITLRPWTPLDDGLVVGTISTLVKFDLYPHYELKKSAFARAARTGWVPENLLARLEELSAKPLPQNIAFTLSTWLGEYTSVTLTEGVVLTADENRRHLIEHSSELQPFIHRTLAPGIYLLSHHERDRWEKALETAGIEMVPEIQSFESSRPKAAGPKQGAAPRFAAASSRTNVPFERGLLHGAAVDVPWKEHDFDDEAKPLPARQSQTIQKQLLDELAEREFGPEQHQEIALRIRHKLVFSTAQMHAGLSRRERTEAKGLDYLGKVRLIEQALQSKGSYLEVVERAADGEPHRRLVRPDSLEKSGTNLILFGRILPEGEQVQILVHKIGLVRKLRGTLISQ